MITAELYNAVDRINTKLEIARTYGTARGYKRTAAEVVQEMQRLTDIYGRESVYEAILGVPDFDSEGL